MLHDRNIVVNEEGRRNIRPPRLKICGIFTGSAEYSAQAEALLANIKMRWTGDHVEGEWSAHQMIRATIGPHIGVAIQVAKNK
jgi:hypothetical protein